MATKKPQTKPSKAAQAKAKQQAASTQAYLPIREVKDGVVVLKDGSLRAVLMTSAVNFALKSAGEQDAMIYAYQRFLNSLNFPVQILIQSRRLDLDFYLEKLAKRAEVQDIELVKLQILEYTEFIKRLISVTNIMDKRFFVVVPFFPDATEQVKGFAKWLSFSPPKPDPKKLENDFQKNKVQLMQRVEAIASGLGGIGLRAATLNSEELVELFYSIYNPSTATKQRLVNVDELTAASIGRAGSDSAGPDRTAPVAPGYERVQDQKPDAGTTPPAGPTTQATPQPNSTSSDAPEKGAWHA